MFLKAIQNWNYERWRTRDRLLDYDTSATIPMPSSTNLSTVYPWANLTTSFLEQELFTIALNNGYTGTKEAFLERFSLGCEPNVVVCETILNFPVDGDNKKLYLDSETGILYYFIMTETINEVLIQAIGAYVAVKKDNIYHVYIPVRAMLIEDTILDGGDA